MIAAYPATIRRRPRVRYFLTISALRTVLISILFHLADKGKLPIYHCRVQFPSASVQEFFPRILFQLAIIHKLAFADSDLKSVPDWRPRADDFSHACSNPRARISY